MALVSPGVSVSISDQSQYVNANVGSIPLVLLATAQDKTYNGNPATGTSKANAGLLQSFTSQRELVTAMGTPSFQLSSIGTPVNGSEINEYGLMASYSALGLSNQLYAIRADIDLNQLAGTSVRPSSVAADGTYWLNTATTQWGIYELNATTSTFTNVTPLVITDKNQVFDDSNYAYNVPTPYNYVGSAGQYAIVAVDNDGTTPNDLRLFYKATASSYGLNGTWVQVNSSAWQQSRAAVVATNINPSILNNSSLTINGVTVTVTGAGTTNFVNSINSYNIAGVYAQNVGGYVNLFVTSAARSGGASAAVDGKLTLTDGVHAPLALAGISTTPPSGYYWAPILFYGNYAQAPSGGWFSTDSQPRPTGSIWWKTTATGGGFNPSLTMYDAATGKWVPESVPFYGATSFAIYNLDPTGGGINIAHGQVIATRNSPDTTANALRFFVQSPATITTMTGGRISSPSTAFVGNETFNFQYTLPGSSNLANTIISLNGATTAQGFVAAILAANIPYITASYNADSQTITISHTAGGQMQFVNGTGIPLQEAGFVYESGVGYTINTATGSYTVICSNFHSVTQTINYQSTAPVQDPADGTLWYWSDPTQIDIMINTGSGWAGYRTVSSDARGYNLVNTDPTGVIVSPTAPVTQSDGVTSLKQGDLWLDSSDLVNFPSLYRNTINGTGSTPSNWVAINVEDHVSQNGIVFADARWDGAGTADPINSSIPAISTLLTSNYTDLDCPSYQLYPRGTLLFNTRRSGYNIKRYQSEYFTSAMFPGQSLPSVAGAWVTASGLDANGVVQAGSKAQRAAVVSALQSAIDSNLDVLSSVYNFNLIVCPGYPELIPNMLTLNSNRSNTAFVIGDTPLDLQPNTVDITNWVNNTGGTGLPSDAAASPYLALYYPAGQTNDLAGNTVVVPASHAVLRTYLYNDQVSYPWFAPAGVNRGLISNMSNIGYINNSTGLFVQNAVSQGLRDALFTLNINPLTQLPGVGLVIFGQLTRSGDTTARNRVNVVRLENYLRTIFSSISNGFLFEPNDAVTRKSISSQIENALNNVLSHRGLYDFLVICDTTNNTPSVIANNQLYVDVAIEPERDVEFIYIPVAIYNPGSIAQLNIQST